MADLERNQQPPTKFKCGDLCIRSAMISEQEEERLIRTVTREILISLFLIVIVALIALCRTFPSMYYFSRSLQKYFLESTFSSGEEDLTFKDVKTASHFWSYSEEVLVNGLNNKYWYHVNQNIDATSPSDNLVLFQNLLVGARIRQLKVRNNSCPIHDYMVRNFFECYSAFSESSEDRSDFGDGVVWKYNTSKETPATPYHGIISVYPAGGYSQLINNVDASTTIQSLKKGFWVTRGTRLILYEFTVYNGNVDLFCSVKLAFEFPQSGGVLPSASFETVHMSRYNSVLDFFMLFVELIYVFCLIILIMQTINELRFFELMAFVKFWCWVDLIIVILSIVAVCLRIHKEILFHVILETSSDYPIYDQVADLQLKFEFTVAFLLAFYMLKLFEYLEHSPVLGQLNLTLKRCAKNLSGFTIMFFVVFLAYAELGDLLFGTQVIAFSGFYTSMITLIRTILGDFDYEEIEARDPVCAPLYFLTYMFLVFFVLMNMFIAIISDAYADVKIRKEVIPRTKREKLYTLGIYRFFRMMCLSMLIPPSERDPNSISLTVYEVENILKSCGFKQESINQVLQKAGYSPERKGQYVNLNDLVKNIDKKVYRVPPIPKLPENINSSRKEALISYEEYSQIEIRINKIQTVLDRINTKIETLINHIPDLS